MQDRVAPAVIALTGTGKVAGPSTTGVLITASGLALASQHSVEAAVGGSPGAGLVALVPKDNAKDRAKDRDRVPARVVAVAPELDLALLELQPTAPVFYHHLPIVRAHAVLAAGETVKAIAPGTGAKKRTDGAAASPTTTFSLGAAAGPAGADRWRRVLPGEAVALAGGTPLVDDVGRVVALVVRSENAGAALSIDADALLRFLFAVQAPELRFAGVPARQRPSLAEVIAARPVVRGKPEARGKAGAGDAAEPAAAARHATAEPIELPGVVKKRDLDPHFSRSVRGRGEADAEPMATPAGHAARPPSGPFATAIRIELADLEHETVPATTRIDPRDMPVRGPARAPVTVVELGDYHAPNTREADELLRSLLDAPAPAIRVLWKDTDRGEGADYHLAARAARAAGEQGQFWALHDRLLSLGHVPTADRLKGLLRLSDLDEEAFATAFASDAITNELKSDGKRAGRLPVLCTPAFVVNGVIVEGGSLAGPALRAAVEAELRRHPATAPAATHADTSGILGQGSSGDEASPLRLLR